MHLAGNRIAGFWGVCVQEWSKTWKKLQELVVELGQQGYSHGRHRAANSEASPGATQRRLPENLGVEGLDLDSELF